MTGQAIAARSREPRADRFQRTERALWDRYGLQPTARFVHLPSPDVRLRVLESGAGRPVLFVHGTVGPGAWASLVGAMPGFRSIVLDRPGWGLSEPVDFSKRPYRSLVATSCRTSPVVRGRGPGRSLGPGFPDGSARRYEPRDALGREVALRRARRS